MEDRLPEIKHAVVAVNREEFKKLERGKKKLASEMFIVFYKDKTVELFDVSDIEEDDKLETIQYYDQIIKASIDDKKKYETLYSDSKDFEKIYAKAEKIAEKQNKEDKKDSKLGAIALSLGIIGLAGITGVGAYHIAKNIAEKNDEDTKTEAELDTTELVPSIEGKDFAFYSENALPTEQKTQILNINNWVSQNGAESWQKVTLTEEQMKELGYENPECLFGFTAEEAYALTLRFGNYTNEQYATLTGGSNIDVEAIDSISNRAIQNIVSYYVCSDECDLNIEQLINFNEAEVSEIDEIEGMVAEWKELVKDEEKEQEAFEKMQEIKHWFNEFANNVNPELNNAKSYLLRTILPACSQLSQIYQYEDTILLNLYDTKEDEQVREEIKTALFDEIMMRNLVLGYKETESMGAFDAETFLEENKINEKRYNLLNTDVERSIADQYFGAEIEKLNHADEYISSLRTENTIAESAFQGSITIDPNEKIGDQVATQMDSMDNVETKYDELTHGTYEIDVLLEMLNNNLKDLEIYPQNINYFRSAKLAEMNIEYNSTHGVTRGKKGDTITVEEVKQAPVTAADLSAPNAIVYNHAGEVTNAEEAMKEAREEENDRIGIPNDPEAEARERTAMLQNVYDATYNYFYTGNASGYNAGWASSSDSDVVNRHNSAKNDALNRKALDEEAAKFNNQQNNQTPTIDPEFTNAETSPTPVAGEVQNQPTDEPVEDGYSTTPPTDFAPVVGSGDNNSGVIIDPEFADAEMYTSYSAASISDEEWEQLILPTEEVVENTTGNTLVK